MSRASQTSISGMASYLPSRWMSAADISARSGIPEPTVVHKLGLRGKHVAGDGEHVSDMAALVGSRVLAATGHAPHDIDAVVYFGSTWKDYPVWQAAPHIADRLGCSNAFALELDYVSCGAPVALRVCRNLLLAEPDLHRVLLVAACRESHLVDYTDERARFTYNFGDGAAGALLVRDESGPIVLGSYMVTDGSFAHHVKVPAGGSVAPASMATVATGRHLLEVTDPAGMKARLDPVSLPNFVDAAHGALKRSGLGLADVSYVCGIHMKQSMHVALLDALGVRSDRAVYLDDTGHMSGVDPLLALDRAARSGLLHDQDVVLLIAAGTGYTWAASVVRWQGDPAVTPSPE